MRDHTKFLLAGLALAVAALATASARAGNADVPTAQYFSVEIQPFMWVKYVGADPTAHLLIDDITYSAHADPCLPSQRCAYFSVESQDPSAPLPPNHVPAQARGVNWVATLLEVSQPAVTPPFQQEFDRMSHSSHAELYVNQEEIPVPPPSSAGQCDVTNPSACQPVPPPPPPPPHPILEDLAGVELGTWAVETSESRHYQSPQIIQPGHEIILFLTGTPYTTTRVFLKGRVVTGSAAPVEELNHVQLVAQP